MKHRKDLKDEVYLKKAIEISKKTDMPKGSNYPKVGVIVVRRDDRVFRCAFKKGRIHAEAQILAGLPKNSLRGATLYTTLEPCSHRNNPDDPSCAELIVRAGISRVVIGMLDPNPAIRGRAVDWLRRQGVTVKVLRKHSRRIEQINKKFLSKKRVVFFSLWGTLVSKNSKWCKIPRETKIVLRKLRRAGYKIGVIVNKPRVDAHSIKKLFGDLVDYQVYCCAQTPASSRTQFELICSMLNKTVVNIRDAIIVSGSWKDIKEALRLGFGRAFYMVRGSEQPRSKAKNVKAIRNLDGLLGCLIHNWGGKQKCLSG